MRTEELGETGVSEDQRMGAEGMARQAAQEGPGKNQVIAFPGELSFLADKSPLFSDSPFAECFVITTVTHLYNSFLSRDPKSASPVTCGDLSLKCSDYNCSEALSNAPDEQHGLQSYSISFL